ncbi:uncharacterized protein [Equus caballus]|uniref:uncharacterized protein n=1 Tax=Equus caballus TaxID=9796 RepID=UPI0003ACAD84|nr:uncharacterized protein LOC102150547 isoform X1 [Equus caballus]XP_023490537.1 uncharacterized protein LOC102150547 isoform X1 [Equus caballus]XP_023490538.1 uncharacterized protein LOC102150547 isoform X1 [Equus caballus]XP_023490539.1 uncharacterized protein LOC102150547 isoform X1 [Equus caballus]
MQSSRKPPSLRSSRSTGEAHLKICLLELDRKQRGGKHRLALRSLNLLDFFSARCGTGDLLHLRIRRERTTGMNRRGGRQLDRLGRRRHAGREPEGGAASRAYPAASPAAGWTRSWPRAPLETARLLPTARPRPGSPSRLAREPGRSCGDQQDAGKAGSLGGLGLGPGPGLQELWAAATWAVLVLRATRRTVECPQLSCVRRMTQEGWRTGAQLPGSTHARALGLYIQKRRQSRRGHARCAHALSGLEVVPALPALPALPLKGPPGHSHPVGRARDHTLLILRLPELLLTQDEGFGGLGLATSLAAVVAVRWPMWTSWKIPRLFFGLPHLLPAGTLRRAGS